MNNIKLKLKTILLFGALLIGSMELLNMIIFKLN